MSGRWATKYSQTQRDALAYAYDDLGIHPASRVVDLAKAGKLEFNGEQLPPFETNENTVRDEARKLRKRRAGRIETKLGDLPGRDGIEHLRRRMLNVADAELEAEERKKAGRRDQEKLRQIAVLTREAARIPLPNEPRPAIPAGREPRTGVKGAEARGGLAGALIQAHRGESATEQADPSPLTDEDNTDTYHGERDAQSAATGAEQPSTEHSDDDVPGSWARIQAAQLEASSP